MPFGMSGKKKRKYKQTKKRQRLEKKKQQGAISILIAPTF